MDKLSNVMREYGFVKAGDAKLTNYYARMKDGGILSVSFSTFSHCSPSMIVAIDHYDALDIAFVKNGDLYTPGFLAEEFQVKQGTLSYFPVSEFRRLVECCV